MQRKRGTNQQAVSPAVIEFDLHSPVLKAKKDKDREEALHNLAPFWALLRMPDPHAEANMALETIKLPVKGFIQANFSPFTKGFAIYHGLGTDTFVEITVAVNSRHVEEGEILTLPHGGEDGIRTMGGAHAVPWLR